MRRAILCSLMAGLLLVASSALADEIVPLVPKLDPPAAAERISQFHDALAQGLKAGGVPVMPAATVRGKLKLGLENAGCDEGPCLQTHLGLTGGSRAATARVSSVGKNYTIEVRLFRGSTPVAKNAGRCDICTNAEAVETLVKLATELGSKAEEPPPPPPVTPPPQPEPDPETAPGPKVQPAPQPPKPLADQPPGPAPKRRVWPLWPALAAAGVGVVGIAIGAPLIAIDGDGTNCRGEARADFRNCQDLYSTAGGGWTLTAMGLAGLAASGVLFYLHFSSKPKEQARTQAATLDAVSFGPLPEGGVTVGATGRF